METTPSMIISRGTVVQILKDDGTVHIYPSVQFFELQDINAKWIDSEGGKHSATEGKDGVMLISSAA